jgi:hypothetical protein
MTVVLAPISQEKLARWKDLGEQLSGPRRAAWEDYLRRYGITRHVTFLVPGSAGPLAVLFMEGPGAETLMQRFATSQHAFDQQLREELAECHGLDFTQPPPGAPQLLADLRI